MDKKENRGKYLLKNTTIFAISNIATKLITFVLIPLYTYCLTTEEYGIVDLLFTITSVLIPIFTLNISEAVYRFSLDKDSDSNKILNISCILIFFAMILGLLSIPVLSIFPQYLKYKVYFYFYLIASMTSQIFLANLKGQEKLKKFAWGNIINTFFTATLNIVFLSILKMKIEGYFLACIIANFIAIIYAFIAGKVQDSFKNFSLDKKLFKEMTKYSVVLIPTSFMWWIMNSSDRIMISEMVGDSANGIYAVSYKIPSILTTIAGIFNQAWVFSAIGEKDSKDNEEYTNKVFKTMYIYMFIIAICICVILKPFMKIYVSSEYFIAWKYVPFLLFGSVFMTLGTFVSTSYNVYKDSKGFLFSGMFGAIMNIILNFILIPSLKVYGAAIATSVSYIIVCLYRIIDTRKYVKIKLKNEYIILIFILFIVCVTLFNENIYGQIMLIIELIVTLLIFKNIWWEMINKIFYKIKRKIK